MLNKIKNLFNFLTFKKKKSIYKCVKYIPKFNTSVVIEFYNTDKFKVIIDPKFNGDVKALEQYIKDVINSVDSSEKGE